MAFSTLFHLQVEVLSKPDVSHISSFDEVRQFTVDIYTDNDAGTERHEQFCVLHQHVHSLIYESKSHVF